MHFIGKCTELAPGWQEEKCSIWDQMTLSLCPVCQPLGDSLHLLVTRDHCELLCLHVDRARDTSWALLSGSCVMLKVALEYSMKGWNRLRALLSPPRMSQFPYTFPYSVLMP